jgi:hypothetical protein
MSESPLSSMPFSAASAFWFDQHSRYIKPNTAKNYIGALKVLRPFFGEILLRDITIADLRRDECRPAELCRRKTVESNEGHVRRLVEFFDLLSL